LGDALEMHVDADDGDEEVVDADAISSVCC
jgi:hypothetical protein